jgi:hypothetical protein
MKIVSKKLTGTTAREVTRKGTSLKVRRVRREDGGHEQLYVVDFGSKTIDRDLTYVFGRNVARARAENKRLLGSADGRSPKN